MALYIHLGLEKTQTERKGIIRQIPVEFYRLDA